MHCSILCLLRLPLALVINASVTASFQVIPIRMTRHALLPECLKNSDMALKAKEWLSCKTRSDTLYACPFCVVIDDSSSLDSECTSHRNHPSDYVSDLPAPDLLL